MLQNASLGGSLLAAMMASLCCIGPLLAVALGAGGFVASTAFNKWRLEFLGVTFALLALAWYLTYRRQKASCTDDSACATRPACEWNKVGLWFATGFILIAAAFPTLSSTMLRATQTDGSQSVAGTNTAILKLKIPGMDCAACAVGIQVVLRNQPGMHSARVAFDIREAVMQYDATKLSPEKIIAVINQTGFKAELVPESKHKEK